MEHYHEICEVEGKKLSKVPKGFDNNFLGCLNNEGDKHSYKWREERPGLCIFIQLSILCFNKN